MTLFQNTQQGAARTVGQAQLEKLRGWPGDPALVDISAGLRAVRSGEVGPEMVERDLMHLAQNGACFRPVVSGGGLLRQFDAVLLGQFFERLPEREPLDIHHETEDVAFGVAAEAFVELMVGIDREGRGLLVMERAEAGIPVAEAAQARNVIRNDANDIELRFDVLGEIHSASTIIGE